MQIPKDVKEGDYDVKVDVEFNRGSDIVSVKKSVHVLGQKSTAEQSDTIISVDSISKSLVKGEESIFKLTFANLGQDRNLYNIDVIGAETWADVTVEPGFLSVGSNEAREFNVKVTPKTDAATGTKVFTLKVSSNNKPLKEINLNANVSDNTSLGTTSFRKVLEVLFAILIVVLIVLALIIAFRKARGSEQGPGVETNSEQTYY